MLRLYRGMIYVDSTISITDSVRRIEKEIERKGGEENRIDELMKIDDPKLLLIS